MVKQMGDVAGLVSVAASVMLLLALTGCAAAEAAKNTQPAAAQESDAPPEGWRWESYEDVRLAVPDDWGYGTTGRPWCQSEDEEEPFVGRPGYVREMACVGNDDTQVDVGGRFVWFGVEEPTAEPARIAKQLSDPVVQGDRAAIQAGVVRIYVQVEADIRQKILDSISFTEVDHNGCSADAPYKGNPAWRPQGPAVDEITDVQSITACRYSDARLLSSLRLNGDQAQEAQAALAAAPEGGGPFNPAASCVPVEMEAEAVEQIVLQIDAAQDATVSLRYGGCSSTGQDDGTTVRTLTRESLLPFVQGPNRISALPYGLYGIELY